MDFSFADVVFRVTTQLTSPPLRPPNEYAPFIRSAGNQPPDAIYETRLMPANSPPPAPEKVFWDNGVWRTRLADTGGLEIDCYDILSGKWRPSAQLSPDFATGELLVPEPAPGTASILPLYHPQDRAVILGRMCRLNGLMMHASSILVDGRVLVFAGMSGAGKTTLARLWRSHGATLLNDERTLIHKRAGSIRAGASPWHGEENQVSSETGPLAGIFFLKQASVNRLNPLPLTESLPRMMTTAYIPVFMPEGLRFTLDTCATLLQERPAYELEFTPDARALGLCRTVLHASEPPSSRP